MMQGGQGGMQIMFLVFMLVIFWFMLIRPQRVQQKQRKEMLGSLKVGDKIITTGGVYGTITKVNPQSLRVKIAKNVEIRITRGGVSAKTSKDDAEE